MNSKMLKIYRRPDGQLATKIRQKNGEEKEVSLQVGKCFPWSAPDQFISIRDDKGKEMFLLESLNGIRESSVRRLIMEELEERTFLPEIQQIESLEDEIDLFRWQVITNAGRRIFYTRRQEVPREIYGGAIILKDVSGDRYLIANPANLSIKSRKLLWLYLD